MKTLADCVAPAKLNLFLHVVGRRSDGYHLLESAFQLIDLADTLDFELRDDGRVVRTNALADVPPELDLTTRAAWLLQQRTNTRFGVDIRLDKRIPKGGGLGGGSSDAATTLLALNRLWDLGLSRAELMAEGQKLGADVPFFVFGQNALARGTGELLVPLATPRRHFAVIFPGIEVPTAPIFGAPELTRNTDPIRMSDFCADAKNPDLTLPPSGFGHNDLEPVAIARYPEIGAALRWLGRFGPARMSGSGACVFGAFTAREAAQQAIVGLPAGWSGWCCAGLSEHPLAAWAAT